MFSSAFRIVKFGFQHFFRNVWLTAATVSVLALTLVVVNLLISLNMVGKVAIAAVADRIDVSAHFKPEVEEARVQSVKIALLSMPEVRDVEYVSPADVLQRFSDNYKQDRQVIESLGEVGVNPFGATLVIKARSLDSYPKVISTLDDPAFSPLIDEKDYDDRETVIGRIKAISRKVAAGGLAVSGLFLAITLLIVLNTIRIAIFTHREEIGIMRLVGAPNGFIRGPFYVAALLWSLAAVALVGGLTFPALAFAQPYLQKFFGTGSVDLVGFFRVNALAIFGAQFGAVAMLSLLTTKIATFKYMKV